MTLSLIIRRAGGTSSVHGPGKTDHAAHGPAVGRCYNSFVSNPLIRVLEADPRIGFALLFGSAARETDHLGSDVDVGIGAAGGRRLTAIEIGEIASRLEAVAGRPVDVILLDEAAPSLAYRVFRDGQVMVERDRPALVARKTRAILEYLDFQPVEEQCARGVLAAAGRGR